MGHDLPYMLSLQAFYTKNIIIKFSVFILVILLKAKFRLKLKWHVDNISVNKNILIDYPTETNDEPV